MVPRVTRVLGIARNIKNVKNNTGNTKREAIIPGITRNTRGDKEWQE